MVKKRTKNRKNDDGTFDSFHDIVPIKTTGNKFDIRDRFKNLAQRLTYSVYEQHDITFVLGPAGSGKSYLACLFAVHDILNGLKDKIILTRPMVEAGEKLGHLPGEISNKTDPFMMPLYDGFNKITSGGAAKLIQEKMEVSPFAYLRGRTFDNSVCILDEAQNCTWGQLLLFLTRLGEGSKMIITGDPTQSDIGRASALMDVVYRLDGVNGIGVVKFNDEHIVRHRLVGEILKRMQRDG